MNNCPKGSFFTALKTGRIDAGRSAQGIDDQSGIVGHDNVADVLVGPLHSAFLFCLPDKCCHGAGLDQSIFLKACPGLVRISFYTCFPHGQDFDSHICDDILDLPDFSCVSCCKNNSFLHSILSCYVSYSGILDRFLL